MARGGNKRASILSCLSCTIGRHLRKGRQLLQNGPPVRESYLPLQRPSM